jgi:hypothetical protein
MPASRSAPRVTELWVHGLTATQLSHVRADASLLDALHVPRLPKRYTQAPLHAPLAGPARERVWRGAHKAAACRLSRHLADLPPRPPLGGALDTLSRCSIAAGLAVGGQALCGSSWAVAGGAPVAAAAWRGLGSGRAVALSASLGMGRGAGRVEAVGLEAGPGEAMLAGAVREADLGEALRADSGRAGCSPEGSPPPVGPPPPAPAAVVLVSATALSEPQAVPRQPRKPCHVTSATALSEPQAVQEAGAGLGDRDACGRGGGAKPAPQPEAADALPGPAAPPPARTAAARGVPRAGSASSLALLAAQQAKAGPASSSSSAAGTAAAGPSAAAHAAPPPPPYVTSCSRAHSPEPPTADATAGHSPPRAPSRQSWPPLSSHASAAAPAAASAAGSHDASPAPCAQPPAGSVAAPPSHASRPSASPPQPLQPSAASLLRGRGWDPGDLDSRVRPSRATTAHRPRMQLPPLRVLPAHPLVLCAINASLPVPCTSRGGWCAARRTCGSWRRASRRRWRRWASPCTAGPTMRSLPPQLREGGATRPRVRRWPRAARTCSPCSSPSSRWA